MRKIPLPDENRKHAEKLVEPPSANSRNVKINENVSETGLQNNLRVGTGFSKRKRSLEEFSDIEFFDEDGDLIKKSAKKSAKEYALLLVSTHTYTEKALFGKIRSKKLYSEEDIEEAVEYVKGFGYVNDKRLAENSLQRLAERCFGKSKICRYLASKGISEDIIDSLDFSDIDFVYYCKRLLDKYKGKPDEKVMRALLNAGYTYDEIALAKRLPDV